MKTKKKVELKTPEVEEILKIDIGCGPNKKEGFKGADTIKFPNVDYIFNAGTEKWPFKDNSVTELHASHFLEHLTNLNGAWERTHFFNEAYRVLKPEGKLTLIFPHWASNRYYGDPTHKEPFSEMGFYYLDTAWRKSQAPHADSEFNKNGYSCNFHAAWGYNLRGDVLARNQEFQTFAAQNYKEVVTDIIATLTKK